MLWDIFAVIVILYFFKKWKGLFKGWNGTDFSKKIEKQRSIKKFQLFPFSIPVLDGIYILYVARRYGISASIDLINRVAPGEKDICEIPVGPFLRLVFCKDAAVNLKLLNSTDPGHLSRPAHITDQLFDDMIRGGVLGTPYEIWTHQRKAISRVFSFQHMKFYVESMNKHSKRLMIELSRRVKDNGDNIITGQELHDSIHLNLIKIIFDFIVGSEYSKWREAIQFSEDFSELREILVYRILHPECHDLSPIWWFHPKRKREAMLRKKMLCFVETVITHHKTQTKNNDGIVAKCLVEELIKQNAATEEMYNEVGTFLAGGHDTMMVAINFLLHHFACHPEYQRRCRDEVDDLFSSSSDDTFNFTIDELSRLEYLERFILESLRITPTFPVIVRELKTPLRIYDTCTLKPGTALAVSPWMIHHDPRYYPNPEIFDPDRFLPEEVQKRGSGTFLSFSGGPRNCIGRKFSMLEMKVVLAWILRDFEICTEDGLHDVKLMFEVASKPERRYKTTLKARKDI